MSELRRNLLTRKWIIYPNTGMDVSELERHCRMLHGKQALFLHEATPCPYCPGGGEGKVVDILYMTKGSIKYRRDIQVVPDDWDVRVVSAPDPVFRIEDQLRRQGRRLFDTMGSPGAHEIIIMTPEHHKPVWMLDTREMENTLLVLRERMTDLHKDERLGHQFAYLLHGETRGNRYDHSVMNLVAAPFVAEKVQRELSGAHEWFKMKERCLFCDIYEEELVRREKGRPHGFIEETAYFSAFIPYFASIPFEVWVQPVEHVSAFPDIPVWQLTDLARLLVLVLSRLYRALGPTSYIIASMNQPCIRWGADRGYWDSIKEDWHWRFRLLPDISLNKDIHYGFYVGTGSHINPVLPEVAAEYLRSV